MDPTTAHAFGGVALAGALALAVLTGRAVYRTAINKSQRRLFRFVFKLAGLAVLAIIALGTLSLHAMLTWDWVAGSAIAAVLGGMQLQRWASRRLKELGEPDPYVLMVDGNSGASAFVEAQGV